MNKSLIIVAVLMLGLGAGMGFFIANNTNLQTPAASDAREPLFYRNAMNASVTSPVPTKDAMGMDYVPVYSLTEKSTISGLVNIDPVVVQNIGVRTTKVKLASMSRLIKASGRVDFNEERMARLHPKLDGWIDDVRINKTGDAVEKGDVLLSIYSPKLVSSQQEYLLALNNLEVLKNSPFEQIKQGALALVKSSRQRLTLFDVPEHQIKELEESREVKKNLHIHSPVSGTVIRIGSRQGQYVTPNTELYMMVDLSQVWVYADVYDYELPWVKLGDRVDMTLASVPGRVFSGALTYIYPYAESKTRTTKVRIVFDNPDLMLRPDMFAEIEIFADRQDDSLVIPSEAVIRSGNDLRVFVVRAPGKFEPRSITLGLASAGKVTVLSGLSEGETIVTSAQFLLDSESRLVEATAKMMRVLEDKTSAEKTQPEMKMDMDSEEKQP